MERRRFLVLLPAALAACEQSVTRPSSVPKVVLVPPSNNYRSELVVNEPMTILDALNAAGFHPIVNTKTSTPGPYVTSVDNVSGQWLFYHNGTFINDNVGVVSLNKGDHVGCFMI